MKISFITKKFYIPIYLPNKFILSKFILNKIGNSENDIEMIRNFYPLIKKFIKENGHFNLVEIYDASEKIKIKIKL